MPPRGERLKNQAQENISRTLLAPRANRMFSMMWLGQPVSLSQFLDYPVETILRASARETTCTTIEYFSMELSKADIAFSKYFTVLLAAYVSMARAAALENGVSAFQVIAPSDKSSFLVGSMHAPLAALRQPGAQVFDGSRVDVIKHTTHDEKWDNEMAPEVLHYLHSGQSIRAD